MPIKNNLVGEEPKPFFPNEEASPSPSISRFTQWIGIQDFSNAFKDWKEKKYSTAAKSAAVGLLKLGVIGAAFYGIYRWVSQQPVFWSDTLHQAGQDFAKNSQNPTVPSSVKDLTTQLYQEQPQYRRWPTSAKEFVSTHLNSNTLMSSAIITHLISESAVRDDSSLKQMILKTCKEAQTTFGSCLTALKTFIGLPSAPPTQDTLDGAMKIVGQCNKNKNDYCLQAFEGAKEQSLQLESVDDALRLVKKISPNPEGHLPFVEKAIDLFTKHLESQEKIVAACEKAETDPSSDTKCLQHATFRERLQYLEAMNSHWARNRYYTSRFETSRKEVNNALESYGVGLAEVCMKFKDSEKCSRYVDQVVRQLIERGLLEEAFRLLAKDPAHRVLDSYILPMLNETIKAGKLQQGALICAQLLKENLSPKIKEVVTDFWNQLLASHEPHLAIDLLQNGASLYEAHPALLDDTIAKVLSLHDGKTTTKLYLIAKTWIAAPGVKNHKQLLSIITSLFEKDTGYYSSDKEPVMAKVLATLLIEAKNPKAYNLNQQFAWELSHSPGCEYDSYDRSLTKQNWQQKLI